MPTAKERIKQMVDELPEPAALEVERMLRSLAATNNADAWQTFASAAFASWFEEAEYQYPDEPLGKSA